MTVDSRPNLTFHNPTEQDRKSNDIVHLLTNPGTSPDTGSFSPEAFFSASTPGEPNSSEQGAETRLIDMRDETWAMLLDSCVDDPNIRSGYCCAQTSGYLLKRAGANDEDGLLPLAVSIVHGDTKKGSLLTEVLGMYRNLATLARMQNIADPLKGILPWHIAAAERAYNAVSTTMRYDGVNDLG